MSVCTRCQEHPNFHSFQHLGTTHKGHGIYYSKPYIAIEKDFKEESIPNYLAHMDSAAKHGPWIYVFDASDLDKLAMPNILTMRRFYKIIEKRYAETLRRICILNLNWKTKLLLDMIMPFVSAEAKKRLCQCTTPLELVEEGVPTDCILRIFPHGRL